MNSDLLGQELKVAEDMKKDLRGKNKCVLLFEIDLIWIESNGSATSNDLVTAKTNLASTRMELNSTKSAVADLVTKLNGKIFNKNVFPTREKWKNFNLKHERVN